MSLHTFHVSDTAPDATISTEASTWGYDSCVDGEHLENENHGLRIMLSNLSTNNQSLQLQLEIANIENAKLKLELDKQTATFGLFKIVNGNDERVTTLTKMNIELKEETMGLKKEIERLEGCMEEMAEDKKEWFNEKMLWVQEKIKNQVDRWMVAGMEVENMRLKAENEELKREVVGLQGLCAARGVGGKKKMRADTKSGEGKGNGEAKGFGIFSS
jgi:hypothetical protein